MRRQRQLRSLHPTLGGNERRTPRRNLAKGLSESRVLWYVNLYVIYNAALHSIYIRLHRHIHMPWYAGLRPVTN